MPDRGPESGRRGGLVVVRTHQSILFLPVMLSLALVGIIWEFMYSQNYGLINTVIGATANATPSTGSAIHI